jgi:hypothetical protein
MKGFAIEYDVKDTRNGVSIIATCSLQKIPYTIVKNPGDVPEEFIPFGNVAWIETCLGRKVRPEYFPKFTETLLHRKIWIQDCWPSNGVHVKPADEYKRYQGRMADNNVEVGPHLCSEFVNFENEWRYYITKGEVISAWWYAGKEEQEAPDLPIKIPKDWYGTLDVGTTLTGLQIVEAHHPFSCGWYGETYKAEKYLEWLSGGWGYMKRL